MMEVKQGTREGGAVQMRLKSVSQLVELGDGMIVTDDLACCFPDMLLRIEIGCGGGPPKDLEPGVVIQEGLDQLAAMPRGPVP